MTSNRMVLMEKNRLQLELKLQAKIIAGLRKQGWWADKTSDRFKAGKPDLRIANKSHGQLDIELKYSLELWDIGEYDTQLKKLQQIKIREMNDHGIPAVGLVYVEAMDLFFVTTVLRETLPPLSRRVPKLPGSEVISGPILFVTAMEYLNDLGHHTQSRHRR